jgi:hypothetical protein
MGCALSFAKISMAFILAQERKKNKSCFCLAGFADAHVRRTLIHTFQFPDLLNIRAAAFLEKKYPFDKRAAAFLKENYPINIRVTTFSH